MKRAKYINTDNVEIIDDDFIKAIHQNYNSIISSLNLSDENLNALQKSGKTEEYERKKSLREIVDKEKEEELNSIYENYLEYIECDKPELNDEYSMYKCYYTKEEGKVYEHCNVIKNVYSINAKINELKTKLSSTDYIIIKAYEAKVTMQDAPYTDEYMTQITEERQKIRDEINRLEELLKTAK